jgi:predicted nucleotidyltransferase
MSVGRDLRLSREDIEALLSELGSELAEQGARADVFLVGGAAMALAYNLRRLTADVDAVFEPKAVVYAAASRIAERHPQLPADWLNDAVKGFLPGTDSNAVVALDLPGIRVTVASPPYLLALKVLAARQDRDADDLRELARLCGVRTAREVLEIAERHVGESRLTPKARFLVEELFST